VIQSKRELYLKIKDQIFFRDEKTLKNNTMWIITDEDRLKANREERKELEDEAEELKNKNEDMDRLTEVYERLEELDGLGLSINDNKIEEYMRDYTNYIVKLTNEKLRKKREEERGGVKRKTRGRKRVSKKRKRSRRRSLKRKTLKRKRRKSNRRNKMKGGFFWSAGNKGPNTKEELETNLTDATTLLRISDDENTNTDLTFKKVTELLPNDNKYVIDGSNLDLDVIPDTTKGNDLKDKLKIYYKRAETADMIEKIEENKEENKKE